MNKNNRYQDSTDNLLGVNFNRMANMGQTFKEFLQIGKDDNPVQRALIKGRLNRKQAQYLSMLITIAPDDLGTQRYVLNYIASSMGENGWQTLIASMISMNIAVPEWGKPQDEDQKKQKKPWDRFRKDTNGHDTSPILQESYDIQRG